MYNLDENLTAILGPTNTGKTFKAFEKLFSYNSGIFGFPLRLLARENYDKAIKKVMAIIEREKAKQKRQNANIIVRSNS